MLNFSRPDSLRENVAPSLRPTLLAQVLSLFLLALCWMPTILFGQEEEPGVFGEIIDVRVVNLEVVVTDKDDIRVHDLKPEDFILKIDGKEAPIEYFTEVFGGTAVMSGEESAASTLPALAPGEAVSTSYLVFIDDFFSIGVHRDRVLRKMIDQLPMLNPEDRMAVVAFDGKKLDMLSTWSNSVESLERTFKQAMRRPSSGLQREAEQRLFRSVRDLRDSEGLLIANNSPLDTRLDIDEQQQADLLGDQVERTVLAASAALRSFAKPPGRKVMLLLSGGWPYNPAEWVVRDRSRSVLVSNAGLDYGDRMLAPLVDTANRLSYTLYPIDVPGFETSLIDTARQEAEVGSTTDRELQIDREQNEHTTLSVLAKSTGGRALLNSSNNRALERVVEDTRSYYWIGFTPTWRGDDENHKVRLEARRKGLRVRARGSFSDLSRQTEVTMMVESSLLFGNPPSAAPLQARLGKPKKAGFGKVSVPIEILIPLGALTFLPESEGFTAQTELRVAVLDEDGATSDVPVIPLAFNGSRQPTQEDYSLYKNTIKMRKKKHDLVVSVYDIASGTILSSKLEFMPEAGR